MMTDHGRDVQQSPESAVRPLIFGHTLDTTLLDIELASKALDFGCP
jgi:hypothetical protein